MNQSFPTSSTLLDGVLRSDPDAWLKFTRLYAPLIYSWGRKANLQPDDVADITQEVFRVIFAKLGSLDRTRKDQGNLRAWMYGITRIAILDHARNRARQDVAIGGTDVQLRWQQILDDGLDDQEEQDEASQIMGVDRILLQQLIKMIRTEFNDLTWQAFWQTTVAGRKASEVAPELGLSSAAVRQAKYRVLKRLRAELAEL